MAKPDSNIKNFRPRSEAANLLMVLDQIAAWRAKHGEQATPRPAAQERPAPQQRPPETGSA